MIQPLKRIVIENREDGTQVTRLPNNEEMMDKINEIIKCVNEHEKNKPIKSLGTVKVPCV
ncbi:hypothetical protein AB1283_00955 [Bacillus sp. S13(2024)]|uniref:hypothetical protein n=1 Tax=Bacillus sp. S13(2024) TaxID=3162885 RepID=UPI003D1D8A03